MKRVLLLLLTAALLSLTAFAANAPMTEAQYTDADTKQMITSDGTIEFYEAAPVLPGFADVGVWTSDFLEENLVDEIDVNKNAFDIVSKFQVAKKPIYGYKLDIFYNPERVSPMLLAKHNIYNLYVTNDNLDNVATAASLTPLAAHMLETESSAIYYFYLSENEKSYLDAYNVCLNDGYTTATVASGSVLSASSCAESELARWPFELTDTSDNWYRTKITGNYTNVENTNDSIYPTLDNVVYYYNENYEGPTFDITGAEKRADGELRFTSTYFSGINTNHDYYTWIVDAGIVLYPTEFLNNGEVLDLNTEGALKISTNGYLDKSSNDILYSVVLTGLEGYESMYFTAKAYVTYVPLGGTEEITVYSDPLARSLNWSDDTSETIYVETIKGMLGLLSTEAEATESVPNTWLS